MATSTTRTSSGELISVNATGLKQLQSALRKADKDSAKNLRAGLKKAGQIVQKQAKANASWSDKIPGSIKVSVSGGSVFVQSSLGQAICYETHGKHPVFSKNRKRWNKVPTVKPFMVPAATQMVDQVAEALLDAFLAL